MKTFTYHAHPLNKTGLTQLVENAKANLITVINGTGCNKEDFNITLKPDSLEIVSKIEGDDWSLRHSFEDGKVLHVRGMKLEGQDCLVFWPAKFGAAHHALKELKNILANFFAPDSNFAGFRLHVSDNAFLTGWMVQTKEDHYSLIQLPTWTAPGEEIRGRTPYTLEELNANESELFINNIWFTLLKDNEGYTVRYDDKAHTFYVMRKFDEPVEIDEERLPYLELGPYEEVNYDSPILRELGLLPPGQSAPEMVYEDPTGRQVAVIKETFDDVEYLTYVLSHGQDNLHDQITLGPKAVFNEQLIAILIHRFKKLDSEIPHQANKDAIAALEGILVGQAARYAERQAEADGVLEGQEVTDQHAGKEVITEVVREADLPRDQAGKVADLTLES